MNDLERLHRQAERYKQSYPPGTRAMLLSMSDFLPASFCATYGDLLWNKHIKAQESPKSKIPWDLCSFQTVNGCRAMQYAPMRWVTLFAQWMLSSPGSLLSFKIFTISSYLSLRDFALISFFLSLVKSSSSPNRKFSAANSI